MKLEFETHIDKGVNTITCLFIDDEARRYTIIHTDEAREPYQLLMNLADKYFNKMLDKLQEDNESRNTSDNKTSDR